MSRLQQLVKIQNNTLEIIRSTELNTRKYQPRIWYENMYENAGLQTEMIIQSSQPSKSISSFFHSNSVNNFEGGNGIICNYRRNNNILTQISSNGKYYYNKYAESYPDKIVPEADLRKFVADMCETKQVDLKKYIRNSLKENLGDKYSATATENLLLEMFADAAYAKERVVQEILSKRK